MTRKPAVLFLCTHNAARSQMTEALLRRHADHRFEAFSAGLQPTEVHPLNRQVLTEVGIDPSGLRSKSVHEFMGRVTVRHAIVVCEETEPACPRVFPFAVETLRWPFADSTQAEDGPDLQLARSRRVLRDIEARVCAWVRGVGRHRRSSAVVSRRRRECAGDE
jgi:arsenate reductase (thioredoxin)